MKLVESVPLTCRNCCQQTDVSDSTQNDLKCLTQPIAQVKIITLFYLIIQIKGMQQTPETRQRQFMMTYSR
jgi:hypothetical protein